MAKNNFKDSIHKEKCTIASTLDGNPYHAESETTGLTKLEYFALKIYCATIVNGVPDMNGSIKSAKEILIRIEGSYNG